LGYDTETERQKARERLNKNRANLPNRFGKEVLPPKLKNKAGKLRLCCVLSGINAVFSY